MSKLALEHIDRGGINIYTLTLAYKVDIPGFYLFPVFLELWAIGNGLRRKRIYTNKA